MVWGSLGQATGGYPSFERVKARWCWGKGGLCRGCFEGWGVSEWEGVVIGWGILVLWGPCPVALFQDTRYLRQYFIPDIDILIRATTC
jgi:hypothetical protein